MPLLLPKQLSDFLETTAPLLALALRIIFPWCPIWQVDLGSYLREASGAYSECPCLAASRAARTFIRRFSPTAQTKATMDNARAVQTSVD